MRLVASGKTQRFCDEGRNGATSLQLSDATAQPHEGSSMDLKNARTAKQGSAKISVNLQAKTGHKVASYAWVYFRSLRYTASPHIKVGRRSWWAGGRPKGIATRKRRPVLLDIFRLNPSSRAHALGKEAEGRCAVLHLSPRHTRAVFASARRRSCLLRIL